MHTPKIYIASGCIFLFSAIIAIAIFTSSPMLVFEADNDIKHAQDLESVDSFEINYVHSYEGTEIKQKYEIDEEKIVQSEERFKYHASGIDPTANTTRDGDWFIIEVDREFESFSFKVSYSTQQVVAINGEEMATNEFADSGQSVEVKIDELNAIEKFFTIHK